ncbi:MAG: hypothetical protein GX442_08880 [Candidatus Riflebacteria bacterium]|nr:hypothetical protein [Candidatus Riflebacteria bacterium]
MDAAAFAQEFRQLIEAYRERCLWFCPGDCCPTDREARLRILDAIERYGDREAFRQTRRLRRWLLQNSSAPSAGS